MAAMGPDMVIVARRRTLDHYAMIKLQLQGSEGALKAKMDPLLRRVVHEKSILLFKQMLDDIAYDDLEVVDVLAKGVK
eukprot:1593207-Karenia_brevis.AAC.1